MELQRYKSVYLGSLGVFFYKFLITSLYVSWILALSAPPLARAGVIFDNFGSGNSYQISSGWALHTNMTWPEKPELSAQTIQLAEAFTPIGNDFTLDTIELAIGLSSGPNELDIWLMNDLAGVPYQIIESYHLSDAMGEFSNNNPLLAANSLLHPNLYAGKQYWVVVQLTGPDQSSGAWNHNIMNDYAWNNHASKALPPYLNVWNTVGGGQLLRGAFRVSGKAIGDLNRNGAVALDDAIIALKIVSGILPSGSVYPEDDVNANSKLGIEEVVYILQKVSGLR